MPSLLCVGNRSVWIILYAVGETMGLTTIFADRLRCAQGPQPAVAEVITARPGASARKYVVNVVPF